VPSLLSIGGPIRLNPTAAGDATVAPLPAGVCDPSDTGGSLTAREFTVRADTDPPCFAAGTRIATTRGLVAVECIQPGDRVCTVLGGDTAEVIWTGHRAIDCTRHANPERAWPVVVLPHAFGRGMPVTDLVLSPEHAVYVAGVLIPIRLLINGVNVRQVPVDRISYHHIELADHDIVLANGMPAETWLDIGNRSHFANGGEVITLHPDFALRARETAGCAPLVLTGAKLTAVKKRLAADAARRRRPARDVPAPAIGATGPGRIGPGTGPDRVRFDGPGPEPGGPRETHPRGVGPRDIGYEWTDPEWSGPGRTGPGQAS
jgi:collagen type I/II/III/V/XI/XXIV/XXVII alpha